MFSDLANYPFYFIHLDCGHYAGKQWVIGADQFSGWPLVKRHWSITLLMTNSLRS